MPMMGDHVEDKKRRQAKVVDLEGSKIMIRWDEGVVVMDYYPEQFTLLRRAALN
jgi:hypothetical protein